MCPKSRAELRVIISHLNEFKNSHDDLLSFESYCIESAIRRLISADYYLAHLGISHSLAKFLESYD